MSETAWKRTKLMERSVSSSAKPRILFILHLPPPVHGASMMGEQIRESTALAAFCEARFINLSASSTLSEIGQGSWKKLLFVLRLLRGIRRELRRWKPDLVYVTPTAALPGFLKDYLVVRLTRRRGVRTVVHFHNKGVSQRQDRWLDDRLYRRFFRDVDVILLSRALYPDIARYVSENRVSICPNGMDAGRFPARGSQDIPEFLFLSNLIPSKGIVDLLDACASLSERGFRFVCRVVGAPSADISPEHLAELVEERHLGAVVRYEGPLYGADKRAALSQADFLVHPTREDCFPLVILEAMAAGLAVVGTREGAVPDEVEEGVTGLLCNKADPAGLADSIAYLLEHPDVCREMGTAGRARYEKLFSKEAFERRFIQILESYV